MQFFAKVANGDTARKKNRQTIDEQLELETSPTKPGKVPPQPVTPSCPASPGRARGPRTRAQSC